MSDTMFYQQTVNRCLPTFRRIKQYTNLTSQPGDDRRLTAARFAPITKQSGSGSSGVYHLLTSSWTGNVKLWSVPSCTEIGVYRIPNPRFCYCVGWHKHSFNPQTIGIADDSSQKSLSSSLFASGYADGRIALFSANRSTPVVAFSGHGDRVGSVVFHPVMPGLLFSCGYDFLWKMWDVNYLTSASSSAAAETQSGSGSSASASVQPLQSSAPSLLLGQEGHTKGVHSLALHPDGSLMATGGLDSHVFLWDLRTGRRIHSFAGHVGPIYSLDFSGCSQGDYGSLSSSFSVTSSSSSSASQTKTQPAPSTSSSGASDGVYLASSSGDNSFRIWDLRMRAAVQHVLAHSSPITNIKFDPCNCDYVMTSSMDGTAKIWNTLNYSCIKTLRTHEGNGVLGMDVTEDGRFIATSCDDRTWKLWGHRSEAFSSSFLDAASSIVFGREIGKEEEEEEDEAEAEAEARIGSRSKLHKKASESNGMDEAIKDIHGVEDELKEDEGIMSKEEKRKRNLIIKRLKMEDERDREDELLKGLESERDGDSDSDEDEEEEDNEDNNYDKDDGKEDEDGNEEKFFKQLTDKELDDLIGEDF
eukprot:MONOS_9511.1-p1 / transcript=MONOS_9511.1 / gene=MONOS_9511 / organism=Monocercomonoides_exilis_PA203 / gene_product=U4/U6 small nuclear ribonucleoprotein PRP4 / transcript_product=U4/U6 small nuclear ribonucleoprotein PRP4 / location=Mono_scaffold00395:40694-43855(+) / protein_length=586 / sequence_SO=supercontig / SO=protein_coding / is_pseudo=false